MDEKQETIKKLLTFFALTIIITTGIYIWMFLGSKDNMTAVLLMMYTPGISAILTSLITKDKIRNYGWKFGKFKNLGSAYILPLIISLVAYGITWIIGLTEFTTQEVVNYKLPKLLGVEYPLSFIVGLLSKMSWGFLLTCIPVFGEELGWSGFLTPKLLKIYSVPVTSFIVGICWAVWHFPAFVGGLYGQGTPLWTALPGFTLVLIGYSFIRTVLVSESKSLWTGVILHSSGNIILMGLFWEMTVHKGYAAYIVSESGILTGVVCVLFALLFWRLKTKNFTVS
jgi:uncharacterized protein